jgi:hypothetical protein
LGSIFYPCWKNTELHQPRPKKYSGGKQVGKILKKKQKFKPYSQNFGMVGLKEHKMVSK